MSDPALVARSKVANAVKVNRPDAEAKARQQLAEAKLRRAVNEALTAFPPLSGDVKASIAHLLTRGGGA